MRVLIPSDNRDFVAELAEAYVAAGCDVVTGAFNFELGAGQFDLLHYQWPEEYCNWVPPTEKRLGEIVERLRWWAQRCPSIVMAHNLYPHGFDGDPMCRRLFDAFYEECSWTFHFSKASRDLVCSEYESARHDRHIVSRPWNFERTLKLQKKRGSCRAEFGFADDDFVILVLGALRSWSEIQLVTRAFELCKAPRKKLLMAGRYGDMNVHGWRRRWLNSRWKLWLWRQGAAVEEGFIADEDLSRYLDSADVIVVPRCGRELNSGVPSLAMTFGLTVIAPKHGAFSEQLAGTGNLLYETGDPQSLVRALERAATLDRKQIGRDNLAVADKWRWEFLVADCLNALGRSPVTC